MKITAIITPRQPIELERLELAIERWLLERDSTGQKTNFMAKNGVVYLTLNGLNDEQAANMKSFLEGEWGGVWAEVMWL